MPSPASRNVTSAPLFFLDTLADPLPQIGAQVQLDGDEGRHAAVVRRIRSGETILIGDGRGRAVGGVVTEVSKASLVITVDRQLAAAEPARRYLGVQALAKGDRGQLAVEMLTEVAWPKSFPGRLRDRLSIGRASEATRGCRGGGPPPERRLSSPDG